MTNYYKNQKIVKGISDWIDQNPIDQIYCNYKSSKVIYQHFQNAIDSLKDKKVRIDSVNDHQISLTSVGSSIVLNQMRLQVDYLRFTFVKDKEKIGWIEYSIKSDKITSKRVLDLFSKNTKLDIIMNVLDWIKNNPKNNNNQRAVSRYFNKAVDNRKNNVDFIYVFSTKTTNHEDDQYRITLAKAGDKIGLIDFDQKTMKSTFQILECEL